MTPPSRSRSDLSVITVAYQSATKVPGFIRAARRAAPSAEVIIVDNGSTDDVQGVAAAVDPDVIVLRSQYNRGFGRGCNVGAAEARGRYLLFANPDLQICEVPDRISFGSTTFGLAAGAIVDARAGGRPQPGIRAETTLVEDWWSEVMRRLIPRKLAPHVPVRRWPRGWASGALMVVNRHEFLDLDGFDRRYFLYYEDRDLGMRYRKRGYPVRALSGLAGVHSGGSSSSGVTDVQRMGWSLVSWLEYVAKWRGQRVADQMTRFTVKSLELTYHLALSTAPRKSVEVADLIDFVLSFDRRLPSGSRACYPLAAVAVARSQQLRVVP